MLLILVYFIIVKFVVKIIFIIWEVEKNLDFKGWNKIVNSRMLRDCYEGLDN